MTSPVEHTFDLTYADCVAVGELKAITLFGGRHFDPLDTRFDKAFAAGLLDVMTVYGVGNVSDDAPVRVTLTPQQLTSLGLGVLANQGEVRSRPDTAARVAALIAKLAKQIKDDVLR